MPIGREEGRWWLEEKMGWTCGWAKISVCLSVAVEDGQASRPTLYARGTAEMRDPLEYA